MILEEMLETIIFSIKIFRLCLYLDATLVSALDNNNSSYNI